MKGINIKKILNITQGHQTVSSNAASNTQQTITVKTAQ